MFLIVYQEIVHKTLTLNSLYHVQDQNGGAVVIVQYLAPKILNDLA